MTATAAKEARPVITERLGLDNPRALERAFDRPNISLRVDMFSSRDEKCDALLRRVEFADKPGIVYVATHRNAEEIAADLERIGVPAVFYHGGLRPKEREEIQNRFMSGEVPVIVATSAFGMGVDKPDIRFVYHLDVSESLDAYYQEMGRAGGDGEAAEAVLFYRQQDLAAQSFKTGSGRVDTAALELVYNALKRHRGPMTREALGDKTELPGRKLASVVHELEEAGAARQNEAGEIEREGDLSLQEIVADAERRQQLEKEMRRRRLREMQGYAECRSCRRSCLLRYLGSETAGPCGNCDRCEESGVLRKAA